MRVLLIQPRRDVGMGFRDLSVIEPLGLELVAGALQGHTVKILDLMGTEDIVRAAVEYQPDMCGISCSFTVDVNRTREIARAIKRRLRDTFIFVGGHHASANPRDFLASEIDCIVIGEGEITARELVDSYAAGRDLKEVKGLVLNEKEEQFHTEPRPLIADLDQLPYPARDLVAEYRDRYYHGFQKPLYTVETARGCPHRCKFCSVWRFYRGKYRMKSPERVADEITHIPGYYVMITDDSFFTHVGRATEIARLLQKAGIRKYFTIQARSDDIVNHPQLVRLWKKVGLSSVFIGFEQIEQSGLNELGKQNSIENNEAALALLRKEGIHVTASFIIDPAYQRSDFQKVLSYIKKLKIRTASFAILTPLPGTQLYEELKDRLLTSNYDLFDLLHTVIPTHLPLEQFYKEYANLYAKTYNIRRLAGLGLGYFLRHIVFKMSNLPHLMRLARGALRLFDHRAYLADHER